MTPPYKQFEAASLLEALFRLSDLTADLTEEGKEVPHEHRCACGSRWQHSTSEVQGKGPDVWKAAHACPSCGTECTIKFPCSAPKTGG